MNIVRYLAGAHEDKRDQYAVLAGTVLVGNQLRKGLRDGRRAGDQARPA